MKPDKAQRAQGVVHFIRRFNNVCKSLSSSLKQASKQASKQANSDRNVVGHQLAQWVAAEILRGENRAARLLRLERFIDIMDCCLQLNNFQSVMSILAALNSTPIYRLHSLWVCNDIRHCTRSDIDEWRGDSMYR
jgi:hypothetical protein